MSKGSSHIPCSFLSGLLRTFTDSITLSTKSRKIILAVFLFPEENMRGFFPRSKFPRLLSLSLGRDLQQPNFIRQPQLKWSSAQDPLIGEVVPYCRQSSNIPTAVISFPGLLHEPHLKSIESSHEQILSTHRAAVC